jgi:hypothetical protein
MELEFHVPLVAEGDVRYLENSAYRDLILSVPDAKRRRELASMVRWMESMGMGRQAVLQAMGEHRYWRRQTPDIDLAVRNPAFRGTGDLAGGIKPFLKVLQIKSHSYAASRIPEILDRNLTTVNLGQLALFPAALAVERIFVIELRGCAGDEFPRAVQQMAPRLAAAARDLGIIFQINGDDETATIRGQ